VGGGGGSITLSGGPFGERLKVYCVHHHHCSFSYAATKAANYAPQDSQLLSARVEAFLPVADHLDTLAGYNERGLLDSRAEGRVTLTADHDGPLTCKEALRVAHEKFGENFFESVIGALQAGRPAIRAVGYDTIAVARDEVLRREVLYWRNTSVGRGNNHTREATDTERSRHSQLMNMLGVTNADKFMNQGGFPFANWTPRFVLLDFDSKTGNLIQPLKALPTWGQPVAPHVYTSAARKTLYASDSDNDSDWTRRDSFF
jgi:hypothetical protein